jgi:hypothetical protein
VTFVASGHSELSYSIGDAFQLASYGTTANPYVLYIDVVPNGDGTYRMTLNLSGQAGCSIFGEGTATKQQ